MHVSVVIPTRNRPDLIANSVASVLANDFPSFDVTVIDQSDESSTGDVLEPLLIDSRLHYVHTSIAGLSRAYNIGAQETRGEILAFTDDDCVAPVDWLSTVAAEFEKSPDVGMLYGQVQLPESLKDTPVWIPTLTWDRPRRLSKRDGFEIFGMGANFAVRRSLFEQLGGFDEVLGGGGPLRSSQDFDFQYRIFQAGATLLLAPAVKVDHYGVRRGDQVSHTMHAYGVGDGAFYTKHIRCGDMLAFSLFIRRLLRLGVREFLSATGLRRRSSSAAYLVSCLDGIRQSMRFPVDRRAANVSPAFCSLIDRSETTMKRIVILGAGPTGLGAAYRLQELGYSNWDIYEQHDYVGGLATSFADEKGFTWDIGGHVLFSHYKYYDDLLDKLIGDDYTEIMRESWVWMQDRFVPYPFQNNIRHLEPESVLECLLGLIEVQRETRSSENFEEWIMATFGQGIADLFMLPYNYKVWAHPPRMMSKQWMAERVSVVDTKRVLSNVILNQDDISWGPNNRFKYPLTGGTGAIYNAFRPYIESHLHLNHQVRMVDLVDKKVGFADGSSTEYDVLINTLPVDRLIAGAEGVPDRVRLAATSLSHSSSYIVGIGIARPCPSDKCWLYFPETDAPFYRATYLSNYSPNIAPDDQHFALLTETSYSEWKRESKETIVDRVVDGLISTHLLDESDRDRIVSRYLIDVSYSYPVPTLERDEALAEIQPFLMANDVYSRGRFGAWLYEIGNMDHSVMQGVEAVNHELFGEEETTWKPSLPSLLRVA